MKETIDLLGKIITNILTALYEPFGFSLLLSFLAIRVDDYTGKKMTFFHDPDGLPLELHE